MSSKAIEISSIIKEQIKQYESKIEMKENGTVITVGDIREQLCNVVPVKPMVGPYRIFIVDEAEKMNEEAQNALLKTLEEPPSYAVILLLTTNANELLPTIRSRAVELPMLPVPEKRSRASAPSKSTY